MGKATDTKAAEPTNIPDGMEVRTNIGSRVLAIHTAHEDEAGGVWVTCTLASNKTDEAMEGKREIHMGQFRFFPAGMEQPGERAPAAAHEVWHHLAAVDCANRFLVAVKALPRTGSEQKPAGMRATQERLKREGVTGGKVPPRFHPRPDSLVAPGLREHEAAEQAAPPVDEGQTAAE